MDKCDCFYLGRIVKKFSYKGEVVISLDTDEPHLYKNMESVFVDLGNNLIPFFIEKSLLSKGKKLRVKFEGIDSETDADTIVGSKIFLDLSLLPKLTGNKFYFHEVIGFQIVDVVFGKVGKIIHINDKSSQPIFEIDHKGKIVFIPIIDNFITKVDRIKFTIEVKTPDGLIDLYL